MILLIQELEINQHPNLVREVTTGITLNKRYFMKQMLLRELPTLLRLARIMPRIAFCWK